MGALRDALELFWPALAAGLAIALACGALSVFVVLRRLAFVGHGVSHAAFGGVGVSVALGLSAGSAATFAGDLAQLLVVGGFCVAAALAIGLWSGRPGAGGAARVGALREDTAIGVALVASMALGALLMYWRAQRSGGGSAGIEGWLFGSILTVGPADAAAAWIAAAGALLALVLERRGLLFAAFDEDAAGAFGVSVTRARVALMLTLAVTIVVAMKLAGVILVTALLVIPGAAALKLSDRLAPVFAWSVAVSLLGVGAGLALSYRANLPPGPSVVAALVALLALAGAAGWLRSFRRVSRAPA